mgnify:CR=1 FL=1|jgi:hypothetical protein
MKHTYIFPSILIALDVLSAFVHADGCRYRLWHPPENEMSKRPPGIAVRRPLAFMVSPIVVLLHQFRHLVLP